MTDNQVHHICLFVAIFFLVLVSPCYFSSYLLLETALAKGILDILNETDNSTDEELLEYAMTLVNKVRLILISDFF